MERLVDSIYIHVPFCRHLCNYCDFYKRSLDKPQEQINQHEAHLEKSFEYLELEREKLGFQKAPLKTLYLGGGTPSLWGQRGVDFLSSFLEKKKFSFAKNYQATLEIDPGSWKEEELLEWKNVGINRFSVGVQTLNPRVFPYVDRGHSLDQTYKLLNFLKEKAWNFSVDFLLGVANSQKLGRNIEQELEEILSFHPSHLSLYILTVPEKYIWHKDLPKEDWIGREYLEVSNYLRSQGFHHYEVSNFSKPGFESQHNFVYWEGRTYLGLGASATGQWRLSEEEMIRYKWQVQEAQKKDEFLKKEELDLETLFIQMRLSRGVELSRLNSKQEKIFQRWESEGLVEQSLGRWVLKPQAWVIQDSLVSQLL